MNPITKELAQLWANGKNCYRKVVGKLLIEHNENCEHEFVLEPMGGNTFSLVGVRAKGEARTAKGMKTKQVDCFEGF